MPAWSCDATLGPTSQQLGSGPELHHPAHNAPMPTPPRRLWYQVSLRGLLIWVVLFGAVFGWVGHQVEWTRRREVFLRSSTITPIGEFRIRGMRNSPTPAFLIEDATDDKIEEGRRLFPEAVVARDYEEYRREWWKQRPNQRIAGGRVAWLYALDMALRSIIGVLFVVALWIVAAAVVRRVWRRTRRPTQS